MKTLGEVLLGADALSWRHALYLPNCEEWNESTPCEVADPDENEDAENVPLFDKEPKLEYALCISTVQDIIINARLQNPKATLGDLLEALIFYYKNDAFINS
jgi:hypothetical protein